MTTFAQSWIVLVQEIYIEWVGAQAKLALLEAHAECRAFAAGLPDQATNTLVTEAQAPYVRYGSHEVQTLQLRMSMMVLLFSWVYLPVML